jgi:putative hemolysin
LGQEQIYFLQRHTSMSLLLHGGNMWKKGLLLGLLIVCVLLMAGCTWFGGKGGANMPNPASVYCKDHGGTLEIRTDASGGQAGMCVFPDKSECDEWAYYRGECKAGENKP